MSNKNSLDKLLRIDDNTGALTVECSGREYLEKLKICGLIDEENGITSRFVDTVSTLISLPLYSELILALDTPLDIIAMRDILDILINKKAEYAIYVLFRLIYSFSKISMPQALEIIAKGGLIIEFAKIFLAVSEIAQQKLENYGGFNE